MSNITAGEENNTTTNGELLPAGLAVLIAALNIFLAITASLGNALILVALHKVSSIHPPTKLLFRCLAVTDLCVGLISQPLYATYVTVVLSFITNINWNLDYYIIPGYYVSTFVLSAASILTSTAISVDRLLALSLGLRYRHVVTLRRVRVVIICLWLLSLQLGVCTWFSGIAAAVLFVALILCLLTSLFSYIKIYLRLRHHQNQSHPQVNQAQPPNGGQIPLNIARYKKTVSSIAWVQLALLGCYLPFSFWGMLTLFGGINQPEAFFYVLSFLYLNSSLNPILYCWRIREVREAVKDTIRQLNCCAST